VILFLITLCPIY